MEQLLGICKFPKAAFWEEITTSVLPVLGFYIILRSWYPVH